MKLLKSNYIIYFIATIYIFIFIIIFIINLLAYYYLFIVKQYFIPF